MMISQRIAPVLALALLAAAGSPPAAADEFYTFAVKKQETKSVERWSLADWLDTKERVSIMDFWLAMHSPSPYEFFLDGSYTLGSLSTGPSFGSWNLSAAAYAYICGLELERTSAPDTRYDLTFQLRFFGYHYQASHMRAEIGIRSESSGGLSYQSALAGLGMALYLFKPFGLEGRWRHAFGSTPNLSGLSFSGDQFLFGAFLDFSFLRVYGRYLIETENYDPTDWAPGSQRSGPQAGLSIFF